ncbi:MAG: hypothetical protein AAGA85_07310 [Bacteroidota bacterium]
MSQLEYSKMILSKVSFDDDLFWKEYRKFRRQLRSSQGDLQELRRWVRDRHVEVQG